MGFLSQPVVCNLPTFGAADDAASLNHPTMHPCSKHPIFPPLHLHLLFTNLRILLCFYLKSWRICFPRLNILLVDPLEDIAGDGSVEEGVEADEDVRLDHVDAVQVLTQD